MKKLHCNSRTARISRLVGLFTLLLVPITGSLLADDLQSASTETELKNRIHITADRLVTDSNQKKAEFIGNVKAIQGTTLITSDRLTVFYREGLGDDEPVQAQSDAITKILAQKNVRIVFQEQTALAARAEYIAEKRIVILTGSDSKIIQGNNSISGSKIILYLDDGRVHVEGGNGKRVEAIFYSEENGLTAPKKTE